MSKLLPITSMLLLTVAFAMAKNSNRTDLQIPVAGANKTNQKTVQGCLSGKNGDYVLTDSFGRIWQVEGRIDQLKNDAGDTVAITGRGDNAAVMTGNSKKYIDVDMVSINDFQVSSMKPVSATCSEQNMLYAQSRLDDMLGVE